MVTIYRKEVRRFLKVYLQTIIAPSISTLLFFTVFTLAFGANRTIGSNIDFNSFLIPGLIMMAIINNAFANTSSSLISSKIQGNTIDFLMPPIGSIELLVGFIGGAITRGLLIAIANIFVFLPFSDLSFPHLWACFYFSFTAASLMGSIGILSGLWSEKFEHLAAITNFVLLPFTFLSGTFYSVRILPEPFLTLTYLNPFFYMIDGFRYGVSGYHDSSILAGFWIMLVLNVIFISLALFAFNKGWRLKS